MVSDTSALIGRELATAAPCTGKERNGPSLEAGVHGKGCSEGRGTDGGSCQSDTGGKPASSRIQVRTDSTLRKHALGPARLLADLRGSAGAQGRRGRRAAAICPLRDGPRGRMGPTGLASRAPQHCGHPDSSSGGPHAAAARQTGGGRRAHTRCRQAGRTPAHSLRPPMPGAAQKCSRRPGRWAFPP